MKLYCVAWKYHSEDQDIPDDFGVCEAVFGTYKEAKECLNACAKEDFDAWREDDYKPDMTNEGDYAKIESGGSFYEYKIIGVYNED